MPKSICHNLFSPSCYNMGLSIRPRVLIPWTKISVFSADISPKCRFSVSFEKINPRKIRLPEKSVENRVYRRFFAEKSETAEKSVEKSGVDSTHWEARRLREKSPIFRR